MATRGSSKQLSLQHEYHIGHLFHGLVSLSSGAAEHDAGDVRCKHILIECKMTGHPGKPPKRLPKFIQQLEEITTDAWSEGKDSALALRYYAPDSRLANAGGWVDVVVMLADVAAAREVRYGAKI